MDTGIDNVCSYFHYHESVVLDKSSVITEYPSMASRPAPSTERATSYRPGEPSDALSLPMGSSGRADIPRIAVVGGLSRANHEWERAGRAIGVVVEHHDGDAHGCRAATLAAIVQRADVVIAITMPNSHGAIAIARRVASRWGRALVRVKRLSPHGLGPVVADALALARTHELAR